MKKYRLVLFKDGALRYVNISWHKGKDAKRGDCFVRAISEETRIEEGKISLETYSDLMTLEEMRQFIAERKHWLGTYVERYVGVSLDDKKDKRIFFKEPVKIA